MSEAGVCKIKPEYILSEQTREINFLCVSAKDKNELETGDNEDSSEAPRAKIPRLSKKERQKLKGQNKSRGPTFRLDPTQELCNALVQAIEGEETAKCERTNCKFLHDVKKYLEIKPKDIGDTCYNYLVSGKCSRGVACRFGNVHITEEGKNKIDKEKHLKLKNKNPCTKNQLQYDIQLSLRKKQYNFDLSEAVVKYNDKLRKQKSEENDKDEGKNENKEEINEDLKDKGNESKTCGTVTDEDIIQLKQKEKKHINWSDKLLLSPLTTVGNLPFRRICKEFGADVTCGEMAMCYSILQGNPQEWALVKRHHTEDIFGVQLCANNPHLLTKCGQLLQDETEIDFIDINLGCPIDLVYKQGAGSGLLRRTRVLESCVRNLSDILTIPLTVKTRTGVYNNQNIAHVLAPKFKEWGTSLLTIHGRSREQRFTKSADWEYIRTVAQAAAPMPVFGNGDILSYDDYKKARETAPELSGIMIGRGALIKPWIFTEIKEQKLWDISSSERFEILKKYANYGLEHWGSDTRGVENTRRFMLEWLSFLYRYIPVGLLESPPQKINERPPNFRGRDDLETIMASPSASDWIKISEMLLGPVPENFQFLPKHKANSYN